MNILFFFLSKAFCLAAFFVTVLLQILLGKLGRFLFFLVGVSSLSIAVTACNGGGSDSSEDGFPRDLSGVEQKEDGIDHNNKSIRSEVDTDGDGRTDSVDTDDDNNGKPQLERALLDKLRPSLNGDGRADSVDTDDDNDGKPQLERTRLDKLRPSLNGDRRADSVDTDDDNNGKPQLERTRLDKLRPSLNRDGRADSVDTDDDNDGKPQLKRPRLDSLGLDDDNDGVTNRRDIDDDGDGLIEIATAAELNAVRYALNGGGRRLSEGANLDTRGCSGDGGIRSCNGYELVADISLATYADVDGGKGWQPLGHDTDSSTPGCQGAAFEGTFEGNNFMISDLNINRLGEDCVGLFGHIAEGSEIRNLRLRVEIVRGDKYVGSLVGDGQSAWIRSSLVEASGVHGNDGVGGLVGRGDSAQIDSSSISVVKVSGNDDVGGLVGRGDSTRIHSSSVVAAEVSGTFSYVGGLVGDGPSVQIDSSAVGADKVKGTSGVGGLVGSGEGARIILSSVSASDVIGYNGVGGLVGHGPSVRIHFSRVVAEEVRGRGPVVGGLVGSGYSAQIHSSSVEVFKVNGGIDTLIEGAGDSFVGGLVGGGGGARVHSSSVVVGEVEGSGNNVGGLLGGGGGARIHSSSVVVSKVEGNGNNVGGLVGDFDSGQVAYSYVVSGSNTTMLVGSGSGTGVASYWDSETSGRNSGNYGDAKTSDELRMSTGYEGVYADWDDDTDIFDNGNNEPLAVWCDKDNSGDIEEAERQDDNRIWDFGESDEYPAIRCSAQLPPAEWRSWWSLDGDGKPQLDRTRFFDLSDKRDF